MWIPKDRYNVVVLGNGYIKIDALQMVIFVYGTYLSVLLSNYWTIVVYILWCLIMWYNSL